MTSLIFDNVGDTTLKAIAEQIAKAGGKIEGELRKLDKGGVVVTVDSATATAAMSNMADWGAKLKIRIHLPKPVLRGTAKIIVKNLPIDYEACDIVEALRDEGVEALELYMFKNSYDSPTGTVKATVKGSNRVKEWLERGRGEIRGVRIGVERQRTPMTCFNCNKIGHCIADCKEAKKCKKCGQEGHLKAACEVDAEELAAKCSYCFEEGHRRGECQKKREDERGERHKHKMEKKDPVFENPWKKKPANNVASENKNENENDHEIKKGWGDMKEELQREMKEKMNELQHDMMKQVKEMMRDMMKDMMTGMMKQMQDMKESMKDMMKQQAEWQEQHQRKQQLSSLKRGLTTPGEQQRSKKKMEKEEGEGKNLEEEMSGATADMDEGEGEEEVKEEEKRKDRGTRGKGGKKGSK